MGILQSKTSPSQGSMEIEMDNSQISHGRFHGPGQKPKTLNQAFGEISDWTLFFENRNQGMKKFAKEFKEIQESEKTNPNKSIQKLNTVIVQKIADSVNAFFQKLPETSHKNGYATYFADGFNTWKDFFEKVIKAYTKNGLLYIYVNEFLRNEDWEKLDDLLPYTYSLFKAFLWKQTGPRLLENFRSLKTQSNANKLILYRGAAFDEDSLKEYDTQKVKNFSWNGVISTSLDIGVAQRFKYFSESTKVMILIVIEVDFANLVPQDLNAFDLKSISENPEELEVAISPGSIFELLALDRSEKEATMRLKLVTDAKSLAHRGQFLHGMLQTMMRNGDELKIVGLKEKELSRAIKYCKGNKLIEDLEFCFCTFNPKFIQVFNEVIPKIWNLSSLSLNIVLFEEDCQLDQILECIEERKIRKLHILATLNEQRHIEAFIKNLKRLSSLKVLKLTFEEDCQMNADLLQKLFQEGYNHLASNCIFDVDIGKSYNITTKGLSMEDFEQFGFLQTLHRNWPGGWGHPPKELIESEGEKIEILESFEGTKQYCLEDSQRKTLLEALERKWKLNPKTKVSGTKKNNVKNKSIIQGKEFLDKPELAYLYLSFQRNLEISNQEWTLLNSQGLQHLSFLVYLYLDFRPCYKITDEGLKTFSSEGIGYLGQLTYLVLNFQDCYQLTDEGVKSLFSEWIGHLKSLTVLGLNFQGCAKIMDEGLKSLSSKGIRNLEHLTSLYLNFQGCFGITNEGVESLACRGIEHLKKLTLLYLDFRQCQHITAQVMQNFWFKNNQIRFKSIRVDFVGMWVQGVSLVDDMYKGIFSIIQSTKRFLLGEVCQDYTIPDTPKEIVSVNYCIKPGFYFKKYSGKSESTIMRLLASYSPSDLKESDNSFYHVILQPTLESNPIDDDISESCAAANKKWKDTEVLSLIFNDLRWDAKTEKFDKFYKHAIQCFKSIRKLHLRSDEVSCFSDNALRRLLKEGINNLDVQSPKSFNFLFPSVELGEIVKELIFKDCRQNKNLPLSLTFLTRRRIDVTKNGFQLSKQKRNFHYESWENELEHCSKKKRKGESGSEIVQKSVTCGEFDFSYTKNVEFLEKTIQDLPSFKFLLKLDMNFSQCIILTDERLKSLSDGIRFLELLLELDMNFSKCTLMTDEILDSLSDGISSLEFLEYLNLIFSGCTNLSNKGLSSLSKKGLKERRRLIELNLNFAFCNKLAQEEQEEQEEQKKQKAQKAQKAQEGIECLSSEGITNLKLLKKLHLNFEGCSSIQGSDFESLSSKINEFLTSLTDLNLNFHICSEVRHFGLNWEPYGIQNLKSHGLENLKSLTTLALDFGYTKIHDDDIQSLSNNGIQHFLLLADLSLKFHNSAITNKGLECLSAGLKRLQRLKTLSLNFDKCYGISDKGIEKVSYGGIQSLKLLTSLHLSFDGDAWSTLTNKGLKSLCSGSIQHLTSLVSLYLNFYVHKGISNEGLESLCCEAIQPLSKLKSLEFISRGENLITDQGIKSLVFKGLPKLISLEYLKLPLMQAVISSPSVCEAFRNILIYFGLKQVENTETLGKEFAK